MKYCDFVWNCQSLVAPASIKISAAWHRHEKNYKIVDGKEEFCANKISCKLHVVITISAAMWHSINSIYDKHVLTQHLRMFKIIIQQIVESVFILYSFAKTSIN